MGGIGEILVGYIEIIVEYLAILVGILRFLYFLQIHVGISFILVGFRALSVQSTGAIPKLVGELAKESQRFLKSCKKV